MWVVMMTMVEWDVALSCGLVELCGDAGECDVVEVYDVVDVCC